LQERLLNTGLAATFSQPGKIIPAFVVSSTDKEKTRVFHHLSCPISSSGPTEWVNAYELRAESFQNASSCCNYLWYLQLLVEQNHEDVVPMVKIIMGANRVERLDQADIKIIDIWNMSQADLEEQFGNHHDYVKLDNLQSECG